MVTGIGHAAYGVSDLNASLRFYCGQLGLRKAFELHRDDGTLWIVYLYAGNRSFIELFPESEVPPQEGGSYRHLCLIVDDMAATLRAMKIAGLEPLNPPSVGKDGNTQAWVRDPDGNPIELMQIAPDSDQARAITSG
ncbi:MAG TPA: VOC family protein [Candidatus Latescibacteria bacterium]|jgi:lactoylglutathione lyase|nr:VOC family protein [Candidatus Latescibacterota bacterium]HOF60876.1 VOC family protein [Candidatus Latescibacterota bacterium]HOS64735.1 VOC family protein [Candidatus Latescibacterota bacterium]HOT36615.1 VOC family protein [Candidatus Latescibacterota bacterium]HPC44999.1 VOC family protein [Candidatus Latescibacterota bacterium]